MSSENLPSEEPYRLPPPSRDGDGGGQPRSSGSPRTEASHPAGCGATRTRCVCSHTHTQQPCRLLPAPARPSPSPCRSDCQPGGGGRWCGFPSRRPALPPCVPSQARGRGSPGVLQAEKNPAGQLSHWRSNRRRQKSREEVGRARTGPLTLRGQAEINWEALRGLQSASDSGVGSTPWGPFAVLWKGRDDVLTKHLGQRVPEGRPKPGRGSGSLWPRGRSRAQVWGLWEAGVPRALAAGCPTRGHGWHIFSWLALGRRPQRSPSAGPESRSPRLFPPHG